MATISVQRVNRGDSVEVVDAFGTTRRLRATTGIRTGDQFPVIWVCLPEVFGTSSENDRAVPWPADAVHFLGSED
jgi:hypothetical protein